jgi:plastocyanin
MRALLATLALVALACALAAAALGAELHAAAVTKTVKVRDDFFSKGKVTVKKDDSVKWTWGEGTKHKHTVTEEHGRWTSKEKKTGTYKHKFGKTGTFKVYCATHPIDMKMKVVVEK